jgi:predicted patatin/cPLA2 family phospholipase
VISLDFPKDFALRDFTNKGPLATLSKRYKGKFDKEKLALVIEGGGMSGTISGGMAIVLEELGLIDHFDFIVGCSAGSLNASYIATKRAKYHAPLYIEVARDPQFINKKRALLGKPVMDLAILFDQHMVDKRPYGDHVVGTDPPIYLSVLNTESYQLEALSDFQTSDEVRIATKASCTIPGITGQPVYFRDSFYADGGIRESVPFQTAFSLGATQCLVLRSRPLSYRKPPFKMVEKSLGKILLRGISGEIKELIRERNSSYNYDADVLAAYNPNIIEQITPEESPLLPDTFEAGERKLLYGLSSGIQAMQAALPREESALLG